MARQTAPGGERAAQIADALGRRSYRLVRVTINDGQQRPVPMARAMLAEAADFSPAPARLEAGTQDLSVTVNGEIELSED